MLNNGSSLLSLSTCGLSFLSLYNCVLWALVWYVNTNLLVVSRTGSEVEEPSHSFLLILIDLEP